MNRKNIVPVTVLIIIMVISVYCERNDFSWGKRIGGITYSGNVVFIGAKELALLKEVTSNRIVFSDNSGEIEKITDKSILVMGVSEKTPYGSLRRVTGFQPNVTEVVINTTDALLTDAVKEGTIKLQKKLVESDFKLKAKVDGVLLKGSTKSFDGLAVTLQNFGIFNEGTRIATLDGAIGISPEISITINIAHNEIMEINLITTLNKIDEVTVSSNGSFGGGEEKTAAEFVHLPIIIDSLVFVPEIVINCGFDGTISGEVSSGVRQDRIITSSIRYNNSKWEEDPLTHSESYDFIRPQITENSDLNIFSGPEIIVKLFGVPVQVVKANGFYSLEAEKNQSPFWRLFIGSDGQNTVKADILDLREDHTVTMTIQPSEIGNSNN